MNFPKVVIKYSAKSCWTSASDRICLDSWFSSTAFISSSKKESSYWMKLIKWFPIFRMYSLGSGAWRTSIVLLADTVWDMLDSPPSKLPNPRGLTGFSGWSFSFSVLFKICTFYKFFQNGILCIEVNSKYMGIIKVLHMFYSRVSNRIVPSILCTVS